MNNICSTCGEESETITTKTHECLACYWEDRYRASKKRIDELELENKVLRDDACRMIEYQNKLEELMKSYCYCHSVGATSDPCIYCDDMEELKKDEE